MTSGKDVVGALVADPSRSALVMDFDGVLSPIVDDPNQSRLLDGTAPLLGAIAERLGLVALISGRPLVFLRERVPVPGVTLLGSYGLEELHDGAVRPHPEVLRWLPAVADASAQLHEALDHSPGLRVEDKSISVAVHWRQAPDRAAAQERIEPLVNRVAKATGLRLEPGKLVKELRPPLAQDKGTAVRRLLDGSPFLSTAYAGDDLGDVPALVAVAERSGYALVVTHGEETAPPVLAAADVLFDGVTAFAQWLADLRDGLGA